MARVSRAVGCVLGFTLLACGGGDGGGGTSGKKVSDTTAAERTQVCDDHKAELIQSAKDGCVLDGIGEMTKEACVMKRDLCLNDPMSTAVDCNAEFANVKNCTITVQEVESCLDKVATWSKGLSCDNFGKMPDVKPIACIEDLNNRCPGVIDTSKM